MQNTVLSPNKLCTSMEQLHSTTYCTIKCETLKNIDKLHDLPKKTVKALLLSNYMTGTIIISCLLVLSCSCLVSFLVLLDPFQLQCVCHVLMDDWLSYCLRKSFVSAIQASATTATTAFLCFYFFLSQQLLTVKGYFVT